MVDKEITSKMIIKTLEICANGDVHSCEGCPFYESSSQCISNLMKSALGLIKSKDTEIEILIRKKHALREEISELTAEIERLKIAPDVVRVRYEMSMDEMVFIMQNAKIEAYKEFAERLKESPSVTNCENEWMCLDIDKLLKELIGESK